MSDIHSPEYVMADRANIAELLDRESHNYKTETAKEWIKDFMVKYGAWFNELEKDWWSLLRAMPAGKLEDLDELKKWLVGYFKTKLVKPGKIKVNPSQSQVKSNPEKEIKPLVIIPDEVKAIIESAESKTHAMYLLDQASYDKTKIAEYMNTNPGLVGNGINMYKKKIKKS